jgi:hypothetical protein
MTTGALIFAFNNEKTDYVAMARWSAKRIRHYLNIPVAIATDSTDPGLVKEFEHVINVVPQTGGSRYFEDYADSVSWHNAGRTDAYNLSPYDQTLVLDSDYVVSSNQLQQVLNAPQDFLAHRDAFNVARPEEPFLDTFGRNRFPMWWATVMMFRKSPTAQYIFDCMEMIKNNWKHYRELYGITEYNYRNDYALSIALGIVSGHTLTVDSIPWPLFSVMPDTELTREVCGTADRELWHMKYTGSDSKLKTVAITGQDFHAMGKKYLEAAIAAD